MDNPAPLTRLGDRISIAENNLDLTEIPAEYFLEKEGTLLFQVGKIERSCEGCDGPMSKVTRDFEEMQSVMLEELKNKKVNTIGTVLYDSEIIKAGLKGLPFTKFRALEDVRIIVEQLENAIKAN